MKHQPRPTGTGIRQLAQQVQAFKQRQKIWLLAF